MNERVVWFLVSLLFLVFIVRLFIFFWFSFLRLRLLSFLTTVIAQIGSVRIRISFVALIWILIASIGLNSSSRIRIPLFAMIWILIALCRIGRRCGVLGISALLVFVSFSKKDTAISKLLSVVALMVDWSNVLGTAPDATQYPVDGSQIFPAAQSKIHISTRHWCILLEELHSWHCTLVLCPCISCIYCPSHRSFIRRHTFLECGHSSNYNLEDIQRSPRYISYHHHNLGYHHNLEDQGSIDRRLRSILRHCSIVLECHPRAVIANCWIRFFTVLSTLIFLVIITWHYPNIPSQVPWSHCFSRPIHCHPLSTWQKEVASHGALQAGSSAAVHLQVSSENPTPQSLPQTVSSWKDILHPESLQKSTLLLQMK